MSMKMIIITYKFTIRSETNHNIAVKCIINLIMLSVTSSLFIQNYYLTVKVHKLENMTELLETTALCKV